MGNKKNIFIGLSTLLLVLLLGLSTRTYADTYRTWEADDVRNVIYNYYVSILSKTDAETTAFISNNSVLIQEITNYCNNYNNVTIYDNYVGNTGYGLVFMFAGNATPKLYIYDSKIYVNTRNQSDKGYYFTATFTTGTRTNINDFSSYRSNLNFLYTSTPIYRNNMTTILYDVGHTAPSNLFEGPYSSVNDGIRFVPFPTKISDVYVAQNFDLTAYGCNKNNTYVSMRFGDLIQPPSYLIEEIDVTMSYYNRGKSKWIEKYLLVETGSDLVPSNYRSSIANFKWENYEDYTITFSAFINNEYVHDDCLYTFSFIGKDTSGTPFYIEQTFYIIGSYTIITDGNLDISFLNTGDYSDEYANDLNELASKIDENNDFINGVEQGIINSFTGESGDYYGLEGLILESGDFLIADPTDSLFAFILEGITNVFVGNYEVQSIDVPIPYMNVSYTIRSDFYVLPLIFRSFVGAGVCYIYFKHYFNKIRLIIHTFTSGDINTFGKIALVGLNINDLL